MGKSRLLLEFRRRLQVPANVTIPAGQTNVRVEFTTADDACGMGEVQATAPGHMDARLRYELIRAPVLRWAITEHMPYAPPSAAAFTRFVLSVAMDCVPQPETRLSWKLVRIDAGGQGEELPLWAYRPAFGSFFLIAPTAHYTETEVPGLVLGTWAIVAEIPDLGLMSNQLAFEVDVCEVDITLDRITVVEGQGTLDGQLELSLTAVVPVPAAFGVPSTSLRWPPFPARSIQLGEGRSIFPRARITTGRVRKGVPVDKPIQVILREEDSFILLNDDVGEGSGILTLSCDAENSLDLNIHFSGQVNIDSASCREDEVTGELICEHSTLNKPGNVTVGFKATPKMGP
jgi:hypothetical protein